MQALDLPGPMDAFSAVTLADGKGRRRPGYEVLTIGFDAKPVPAGREIVASRATKSGVGATLIPEHALLRYLVDSAPTLVPPPYKNGSYLSATKRIHAVEDVLGSGFAYQPNGIR